MKIYYLFLAVLLWSCSGTPEPNDIHRYSHKGKVKRLIVLSYQGDNAPQDTADFYSRVLYDFNEEGYIVKMQSIVSMKKFGQENQVYNYEYIFKDGKKIGWTEESVNSDDKGYGTITWLDDKKLEEKGYSEDSVLLFHNITQLNDNYEELTADFTYYSAATPKFHMNYENLYKDGYRYALIEKNQLDNNTDTAYFEGSKEDSEGNPLHIHLRYGSGNPGRYTIRSFEYY